MGLTTNHSFCALNLKWPTIFVKFVEHLPTYVEIIFTGNMEKPHILRSYVW